MSLSAVVNAILIFLIIVIVIAIIYFVLRNKKSGDYIADETERERQKYSIKGMTDFIKHEFDEITRMNLYDMALSEEEFERRKNTKYELKNALKGAGYSATMIKSTLKLLCLIYL